MPTGPPRCARAPQWHSALDMSGCRRSSANVAPLMVAVLMPVQPPRCALMSRLEQLMPGASVRGLVAGAVAKIVQVEWFGDQAVKVTFEEPSGAVRNRLVYRERRGVARAGRSGSGLVVRRRRRPVPAGVGGQAHPARLSVRPLPGAVTTSQIEPLPHQITAVYGEMLPRQPLRFLLADDPGAGKTIMAGAAHQGAADPRRPRALPRSSRPAAWSSSGRTSWPRSSASTSTS